MKKLDKKQVPQFAALCILSAGLFGYFVVRMVSPSPAAAGTLPRPTAEAAKPASPAPQTATTPGAVTTAATPGAATTAAASTAATPTEDAVPPPTPGMRDPFVISAIDTKASPAGPAPAPFAAPTAAPKPTHPATQVVSLPTVRPLPIPDAPALPSPLTNFTVKPRGDAVLPPTAPAAPVAPPAPAWTVTGVLQGETDKVAILRNGEARQIVRTGDFVDGLYRVLDVSRTSVTLRHGSTFYHLTLGAGSTAPAGTAPTPALLWPAAPAAPRPKDAAFAPVRHSRRPFPLLAQAGRSLIKMANGYLAHAALTPPDAGHLRVTETSRVALRFLDDPAPAGGMEDARTRLAMGVTLYRNGQRLEARAAWQSVQATDDFDAAEEAKKLLYRYP